MSTFLRATNRDVKRITNLFPIKFRNYHEPFLSNGDIFFSLFANGRIFDKAYLSSSNSDLIRAYIAVRDEPERLQTLIGHYCEKNSEDFFSNMCRATASPSAYIYVNKASGADGKWRASQFIDRNQTIAKDLSDIERCSRYLTRWCQSIRNIDWEKALTSANEGDVVWLEPHPIPATLDGRIDYVAGRFSEANHVYLNNYCKQLAKKGVKVFLQQSNTTGTHRIFGNNYNLNLLENTCIYVY